MSSTPPVTVVLCTRNRSAACVVALRSLLAMKPAAAAIIVVDQSDVESTDVISALRECASATTRYLRDDAGGLSRARNHALSECTTDIVAFTDDDCTVPVGFIGMVKDACREWPRAGLIFGNVHPGPHDPDAGLIPFTERKESIVANAIPHQRHLGAMGACMVVRRDILSHRATFDSLLGAGARLHAAEDTDLILRCLGAGIEVVETPSVGVVHHGFRTWGDAETLAHHYLFGTAAVYAKHVRLHPGPTLSLLLHIGARWLRGTSRVSYFGNRTRRGARLASFLRGFSRGMLVPIDRATGLFLTAGPRH